MDQLTTVMKDLFALIKSFRSQNKDFKIVRLSPVSYYDGSMDYRLSVKADWLTCIRQKEGLKKAITTISHEMYDLYKRGSISAETIKLVDDIEIIIDRDYSEAEWNELHAIDLLAEEKSQRPEMHVNVVILNVSPSQSYTPNSENSKQLLVEIEKQKPSFSTSTNPSFQISR